MYKRRETQVRMAWGEPRVDACTPKRAASLRVTNLCMFFLYESLEYTRKSSTLTYYEYGTMKFGTLPLNEFIPPTAEHHLLRTAALRTAYQVPGTW